MLRPFQKVARSRNAKTRDLPVPHRVEHEVAPVGRLADARILAAARRFPLRGAVRTGKEDGPPKPPERRAVGREREADARGALADALAGRVFGAVEDCQLAAERGGRGIECVARFPRNRFAAQGTVEARVRTRRDHYAAFADEMKPGPRRRLVGARGSYRRKRHGQGRELCNLFHSAAVSSKTAES